MMFVSAAYAKGRDEEDWPRVYNLDGRRCRCRWRCEGRRVEYNATIRAVMISLMRAATQNAERRGCEECRMMEGGSKV
jgi:hypothetical protein